MFFLPIVLIVVIGIGIAVAMHTNKSPRPVLDVGQQPAGRFQTAAVDPERIFLSTLVFAGLMAMLFAVTGLVALVLVAVVPHASALMSASDARTRASYYLAALLVGTSLWLGGKSTPGCWLVLQRRAEPSREERHAVERRFLLAAIFGTTSVVALFSLHTLLQAVLTLPGTRDTMPNVRDAVAAGVQLVVWGVAWFLYARLGWRERNPFQTEDAPHDVAVYVLSGFSLSFLVIGLWEAIREFTGNLLTPSHSILIGSSGAWNWTTWGAIAAWIVAGGGIWSAIWRYDSNRAGTLRSAGIRPPARPMSPWRVRYLYLVLFLAAPTALGGGIDTGYETLRRLFGYQPGGSSFLFLQDALPPLLIGGIIWAFHWAVVRRYSGPADTGAIAWPRRPGIALLALLGLSVCAPAFVDLLWLGIDSVVTSGATLTGTAWWRDHAGLSLVAGLIGFAVWFAAWSVMERAARTQPTTERMATARRRLLGTIVMASTLIAAGFGLVALWLVFQRLLGTNQDTNALSWIVKDFSTVVMAVGLAVYHGRIFRADRRFRTQRTAPPRVAALLAPGGEAVLADLMESTGQRAQPSSSGLKIEIIGYIASAGNETRATWSGLSTPAALSEQLIALSAQGAGQSALLILDTGGGMLLPFSRTPLLNPSAGTVQTPAAGGSISGDDPQATSRRESFVQARRDVYDT